MELEEILEEMQKIRSQIEENKDKLNNLSEERDELQEKLRSVTKRNPLISHRILRRWGNYRPIMQEIMKHLHSKNIAIIEGGRDPNSYMHEGADGVINISWSMRHVNFNGACSPPSEKYDEDSDVVDVLDMFLSAKGIIYDRNNNRSITVSSETLENYH